ncbi:type B 50S ribosomal protein L31 [Nocardioides plantarum]|uniref:50S ribosomal protein L31 n=1 Tax=Nocardioides plantarum TaxID=29299 RepID=A0ABV5K4V4_9ACTN|nr:type B 50S ribosomal protein L31 [Nocardioides plantarum]
MKKTIHPAYGPVAFRDRSTGHVVLTQSTLSSRADLPSIDLEGATYPVVDVDTSSDSHPFWTGTARTLDSEGRVEAFQRRYGKRAGAGEQSR